MKINLERLGEVRAKHGMMALTPDGVELYVFAQRRDAQIKRRITTAREAFGKPTSFGKHAASFTIPRDRDSITKAAEIIQTRAKVGSNCGPSIRCRCDFCRRHPGVGH